MIKVMSFHDSARRAGYEVLDQPRRGGGGDVARARNLESGSVVALKVGLADGGPRMRRELDIGMQISHPNLAFAVDGGTLDDGSPYIVTEWVDGPTASEIIASGGITDWAELGATVNGLIAGLAALHDAGVLHRDITPSNVLLGPNGPVLIDLGLGSSSGSVTVTAPGDLAGTPRYLAPEVIRGEPASTASDQYALALVLYEFVARRSPFPGSAGAATALHHQLNTMPTPLDELVPSVPMPVATAIDRALRKDPGARWPTVRAFGAALSGAAPQATDRPQRAVRLGVLAGAIVLGGAILVAVGALSESDAPRGTALTDGASIAAIPAAIPNPWSAGAAASLECNLLDAVDFDEGALGYNYFDNTVDPEADGQERTLPSGGVDGSGVLVVGDPGAYGRYAETVAVLPGQRYELSAAVLPVAPLEVAGLRVSWLDEDFALLSDSSVERYVIDVDPGRHGVVSDPAPPQARYATPEVFKDASDGLLLIDEMIFAEASADCAP